MKKVTIQELTDITKKEADKIVEEHYDLKYETHIIPVYMVVKTDKKSGRVASYNHINSIPIGVSIEGAIGTDK